MSFWLSVLLCAVLPAIASPCENPPRIGHSSEIIAHGLDDITCGDIIYTPDSYGCPRYIEAKSNSTDGYSRVRLTGNYSLLGSVSCNPYPGNGNCTISTSGEVEVGCCGSYQAYQYFYGDNRGKLVIGSYAVVKLARLILDKSIILTVGANTTIDDASQSSSIIARASVSRLTFTTRTVTKFMLVHSIIEIRDYSSLQFESSGGTYIFNSTWFVKESSVNIKPRNRATFEQVAVLFTRYSSVFIDAILTWLNVSLSLSDSYIWWGTNSKVQLLHTNILMTEKSGWYMSNSVAILRNIVVYFGTNSFLYLHNSSFTAVGTGVAYSITIGQNSTLEISSNATELLSCSIIANLIIPPNVIYTQSDVSNMLTCTNAAGIRDMEEEFDDTEADVMANVVETENQRIEASVTHYDSCPIGITTIKLTTSTVNTNPTSILATTTNKPASATTTTIRVASTSATTIGSTSTTATNTKVSTTVGTQGTTTTTIGSASTSPTTIGSTSATTKNVTSTTTTATGTKGTTTTNMGSATTTATTIGSPTTVTTNSGITSSSATSTLETPTITAITIETASTTATTSVSGGTIVTNSETSTTSTTSTGTACTTTEPTTTPATTIQWSNTTANYTESSMASTMKESSSRPTTSAGVRVSCVERLKYLLWSAALVLAMKAN